MIKVKMYSSTNCIPCNKLKPTLIDVCENMSIKYEIVWKENDKDNEFGRYQVMSVPTVMITRDGNPLDSFVGLMTRQSLVKLLEKYVEKR